MFDNISSIFSNTDKKSIIITGGIGAVAIAGYGFYKMLQAHEKNECLDRSKWQCDRTHRKVVVLGLHGAGKSRILQCFQIKAQQMDVMPTPVPTLGYHTQSTGIAGINYTFWEGVVEDEWFEVPNDIDILLWVIDSSNPENFVKSRDALQCFITDLDEKEALTELCESSGNMYGIPIVIVISKQDIPGALPVSDVLHVMNLDGLYAKHKIYFVGLQIPDVGPRQGLWRLYELVSFADRKRYSL